MNKRPLLSLLGLLLLILLTSLYLDGMRRNVRIITERSFPAVRILGDLRDLLSRVQIAFLEDQAIGARPDRKETQARIEQLDRAEELFRSYQKTVVNSFEQELIERVNLAFGEYSSRAKDLLQAELDDRHNAAKLRECVLAYRQLQQHITELRDSRLGRVETRISDVDRRTRRLLQTNLVALGALVLAILVSWFGSRITSHDRHLL